MRTRLLLVAALFVAAPATADVPFVERPLTLAPWQVSADIGVGLAQSEYAPVTSPETRFPLTYHVGWGGDVEGAVGLPYVGQLGLRVGIRPDVAGQYSDADAAGRVLDPLHVTYGAFAVAGPELDWRKTLFAPSVVEIGVDVRLLTSWQQDHLFAAVYGVPVRIHFSASVRLDAGVYFASVLGTPFYVGATIPAQLFFQAGDTFFGPEVGLTWGNSLFLAPLSVGFGVGHTFAGVVDWKVEAYASDLWEFQHTLGGGIGVGVRF
jgi:hypothetical protein